MREALYYEVMGNIIHCKLCPHHCKIKASQLGKCGVRKNINDKLYSLNYGKLSAINVDPIEKKPLYRFMEKTYTLSIGSYGCNFNCSFCQNYSISKEIPITVEKTPQEVVELALEYNLPSISYTYNEPSIYYEFMLDTVKNAKDRGIKNIMVTNGYIEEEPLKNLLPYLDGMNIDLKAYSEEVYRKFCNGGITPVKKSIELANEFCHVEVTTLIVPGMNDQLSQLSELFQWLASVDNKIPLHLSRYYPRYRYDKPATDIDFMKTAQLEAKRYLRYVYLGNI